MSSTADTIDLSRLTDYLENRLIGFAGPITLRSFPGGQSNPAYLLEKPISGCVITRQRSATLLKSAQAANREFRVLTARQHRADPMPRSHLPCEDTSVIGSMFYLTRRRRAAPKSSCTPSGDLAKPGLWALMNSHST